MKKMTFILPIIIFFILFSSCNTETQKEPESEEIRAVWISVYDLAEFKGISEGGFSAKAENMFKKIAESGFNHVFLHVRPASDALYKSEIFPWSRYISGEEGISPGYDPLEIFLRIAHEHSLKIHAWINPYRISATSRDMENLSENHPARKLYAKHAQDIYFSTEGIYYNPASERVQALILDGIREIVRNYDIDGIHIDDFFYPTVSEDIDKTEFKEYKDSSGSLSLAQWRREQVNAFVSGMYSTVKNENESIIVSISPSADIEADLDVHFADVIKWSSEEGFCDWMIPQIYYGMKNETMPFKKTVLNWCDTVKNENIRLVIGISSYKCGEEDLYAGSGRDEWTTNTDILYEQLKYLRKNNADGFAVFSYSTLFAENTQTKDFLLPFIEAITEDV